MSYSWAPAKVVVVIALTVTGCTTDPKTRLAKYVTAGKQDLTRSKYQEAVIQFRNAVELDPKLAEAHLGLARAYQNLGSEANAIAEFQKTLAIDARNRDAKLELAPLLLVRREFDSADELIRGVIKDEPRNSRAHALLSQRHAEAGDIASSILAMQSAIAIEPRVEYFSVLGALFLASGNVPEAEAAYTRATVLSPNSVAAHVALSQFYQSQQRSSDAMNELRLSCGLDSHAVPPRVFLAQMYTQAGKLTEAETVFKELKTLAPEDPRAYQGLGLFYSLTNQKDKAVAEFRATLVNNPKDAAIRAKLVETLIDLGRAAEAKPLDRELLLTDPSNLSALISSGRILLLEGQPLAAALELDKAVKVDPKSAQAFYLLGSAQRAQGLTSMAKASFATAVQLNPRMPEASTALAALSTQTGDFQRATQLTTEAIRADPRPASPHAAQAEVSFAKGNAKEAEAQFDRALERDPTHLPALATMVKLYGLQGRSSEAVQRLSLLAQTHPDTSGIHFLLAVAYFDSKDIERSEVSLRKALQLDPKTPEAHTLLANIDLARGNIDKAQADLRNAIQANPRNITNYLALAGLHQKKGEWDEAKKLCEKARTLDAGAPAPAAQLAYLYLEHGGDLNTALSLAQIAKQKLPDSPAAQDVLGWAYYKLGSSGPAIDHLQASAKKVPNNPIFQYHLGMAYLAAGQPRLAQNSLLLALKTDPGFPSAAEARTALAKIATARR